MEDEVELSLGLSIGGGFKKFDLTSVSLDLEERRNKREIHAMRRQEARKKRVRAIESEEEEETMKKKKKKNQSEESSQIQQTPISNLYFPPLQYVPFANGFSLPYHMVPCWAAPAAPADEKNLFHPVAFRPFPALPVKARDKSGEESGAAVSCCSSAVSESRNGMSSREASHSVESKSEQQQQMHASIKSNPEGQSEHSDSSHPTEPTQGLEEQGNTCTDKIVSSDDTNHATHRKTQEEDISTTNPPLPSDKPAPPPPTHPLRKITGDTDKSPKPQPKSPPPLSRSQSLPQMPCVSTTGDGPNGKTINGFLYKYNKTEVSIMCVCHGTSFTPAEFVKHAGGTDVSHPLRHILVVPSAFG